MPSVQIKDVPDDAHAVLRRRAAAAHQSLQEYMLSQVIAMTSKPTIEELFERIEQNAGGSAPFDEVVAIIREDRDRR